MSANSHELRVLVFAPLGRDAAWLCEALSRAGLVTVPCDDTAEFRRRLHEGSGAVVLSGEALTTPTVGALREANETQAAWSDLPIVLLLDAPWHGPDELVDGGNTTVLFRPVHTSSLLTVVRAAILRSIYDKLGLHSRADAIVWARERGLVGY